ncbi:hypothetical protein QR685DRAFT_454053, partial [Neurospora intermedia]
YIAYSNIELPNFRTDILGLLIIEERITVFWNIKFLNTLKLLGKYISILGFIKYFILYNAKLAELL